MRWPVAIITAAPVKGVGQNGWRCDSLGLLVGVVESLGGLYLGESLGQIGIFVIFIAVLLFRPQGLFGARA